MVNQGSNLKRAVKTDEMLILLNLTRTVERGLVRMYDAALDRSDLDDVSDAIAGFRDQADRHIRAVEGLVEDFGGDVHEVTGGFPGRSFIDEFENVDREGILGTFHDMLDLEFVQSRVNTQWSVLKNVAETSGHEELLRVSEGSATEAEDAETWIENRINDLADELTLLEESRVEQGGAS